MSSRYENYVAGFIMSKSETSFNIRLSIHRRILITMSKRLKTKIKRKLKILDIKTGNFDTI